MSNLSNNSGNNKREFWRWPLYILIAVGVLASLAVAGERLAAEAGSKTTLLSLEWGQLKDNAARNGCTVEEALQKLTKDEAGRPLVSGVVYKEPMLIDWQNGGYLQVQTGSQLLNDVRIGGGGRCALYTSYACGELTGGWPLRGGLSYVHTRQM